LLFFAINMKASIVTIGDEILIGQIIDTNSAWIGQQLNDIGIELVEIISVADTIEAIHIGLDQAAEVSDIILMTGGLGPTKDDLTCEALADYFKVDLVFKDELWKRIQDIFAKRNRQTTNLHKEQCYLPANAQLLDNNMGTAPGMLIENGGKQFYSMPGVPYEMKYIMETHILRKLKEQSPHTIIHRTIMTAGQGESILAKEIEPISKSLPKHIKLAFLPSLSKVRIRLTGKSTGNEKILLDEVSGFALQISEKLSPYVYGENDISLEQVLGELCIKKNVSITTAESCTGGLVSSKIVSVPGSSQYFVGSIVAYSNELKQNLLDVEESILTKHGAVSEEVVKQMVIGALHQTGADVGVAISGIAGPGGGTKEKPVGTIWLACGNEAKQITKKLLLSKNRTLNIEYTANVAIGMLRSWVMGIENTL